MSWQAAALAHARRDYPREACGLVVFAEGRATYRPCRNLAEGDGQFVLDPQDYAAAEDTGEVVGVVHSHCGVPATPSQADLVMAERGSLPWHIVSLPTETWHVFQPQGYRAPLIGRAFVHGVLDCYSLIRDWYLQERGIELPDYDRRDEWWRRGGNLYLQHFREAGFVDGAELHHGAVLLMQIASDVPNHGAIYLENGTILHHIHGRLSSREVYGGYWRKHTVKVLRHA